eukprot:CAMPEP_0119406640 /NCGR_PEP_ID=MMETSP1335-20130426/890_1 /TAXON_ID=259385 /ORGANISM="Chrysoculter rhomboideus, Strain RCC1486" /LENGTH=200 /DNA_ID=CAMNT_0007430727 /DNA_START=1 /DNA_END=603 /DNA_ORIENTATION=+
MDGVVLYYHSACRKFVGRPCGFLYMLEFKGVAFEVKLPEEAPADAIPFFAVPVVKLPDGTMVSQTPAIMQTVGKALGLGGTSPAEEAHTMMIVLNMQDILGEWEKGSTPLKQNPERIKKWFGVLEKQLAVAGSGFLVGKGVTYADFFCYPSLVSRYNHLESLDGVEKAEFPKIGAYIEHMKALLAPSREKLVAKGYPMDP